MIGAAHGAQLFVLEHRFYGESQPYDDWSLENLQKLTSEQALADLADFLTAQGAGANKPTLVIGGSYPGALSAWFKVHYPQIALASWASSGVVQPQEDMWQFDDQIYTSTLKSGEECPLSIQKSTLYVTAEGRKRDAGDSDNAIDRYLATTTTPNMRTDDFMFYYADVFVESVQYGNRTGLCAMMASNAGKTDEEIFNAVNAFGVTQGVTAPDYDTILMQDTTIDTHASGRPWTYQYCTEYGFFQIPSYKTDHIMRSEYLELEYWPAMCERVFPGLSMEGLPKTHMATYQMSGFDGQGQNTYFTNGVEDPWQWVTIRDWTNNDTQRSRISDCDDCGHCVEMYTPTPDDPVEVQQTRDDIRLWIWSLFGPENYQVQSEKAYMQ